jgi:hypothetical protein
MASERILHTMHGSGKKCTQLYHGLPGRMQTPTDGRAGIVRTAQKNFPEIEAGLHQVDMSPGEIIIEYS